MLHPYCVPSPGIRTPKFHTFLASCPEGQHRPPGTGRERRAPRGEGLVRPYCHWDLTPGLSAWKARALSWATLGKMRAL